MGAMTFESEMGIPVSKMAMFTTTKQSLQSNSRFHSTWLTRPVLLFFAIMHLKFLVKILSRTLHLHVARLVSASAASLCKDGSSFLVMLFPIFGESMS